MKNFEEFKKNTTKFLKSYKSLYQFSYDDIIYEINKINNEDINETEYNYIFLIFKRAFDIFPKSLKIEDEIFRLGLYLKSRSQNDKFIFLNSSLEDLLLSLIELKKLKAENEKLKSQNEKLKIEKKTLGLELSERNLKIKTQIDEINFLNESITKLNLDKEKRNKQIKQLTEIFDKEKSNFNNQIENLNSQLTIQDSKLKELNKDLFNSNLKKKLLEETLNIVKKDNNKFVEESKLLRKDIFLKDLEITKLNKIIDELRYKINNLELEYNKIIFENDNNSKLINQLQNSNYKLQSSLNHCNELNKSNSNLIAKLQNEIVELKNIKDNYQDLRNKLNTENIDIDIEKVEDWGDEGLRINIGGSFPKIAVNIIDTRNKDLNNIEKLHRYHIFNCRTLIEMRENKKIDKYSISSRNDNKFKYRLYNNKGIVIEEKNDQELFICKNCLEIYNSTLYNKKSEFMDQDKFNNNSLLADFIKHDFITVEDNKILKVMSDFKYDYESIPNQYSKEWKNLSRNIKEAYHYTCQKCKLEFQNDKYKKYLHVHHKNFRKFDNNPNNLIPLCIECHSKEEFHSHILKSKDFKDFIKIKENRY